MLVEWDMKMVSGLLPSPPQGSAAEIVWQLPTGSNMRARRAPITLDTYLYYLVPSSNPALCRTHVR